MTPSRGLICFWATLICRKGVMTRPSARASGRSRSLFEEAFATEPNNPAGYMLKAIADVELGRDDDARAEAAEVLRLSPHYSLATWQQAYPLKDPVLQCRWRTYLRKAGLK